MDANNNTAVVSSVDATDPAPGQLKRGQKRRPRARGLRTSTGCLTCRRRRVKCSEEKPRCSQCSRGERGCEYRIAGPGLGASSTEPLNGESDSRVNRPAARSCSPNQSSDEPMTPIPRDDITFRLGENQSLSSSFIPELDDEGSIALLQESNQNDAEHIIRAALSPLIHGSSFSASPGAAPFDWYQVLAEDALNNIQEYTLANDQTWDFDPSHLLSHPPSYDFTHNSANQLGAHNPSADYTSMNVDGELPPKHRHRGADDVVTEPWNLVDPLVLDPDEAVRFQHFTKTVGPILDLFDPFNHFSHIVPHLALRNTGLMKSMLAVAARHLSLTDDDTTVSPVATTDHPTPTSIANSKPHEKNLAVQYYYETLCYLSQAMQYLSYARSPEILATAIMISTYEMFDDDSSDWERHLRGAFWIQRTQDNDGESNGLKRAVWWAWLRQDIWAAFRHKRKTMTIWRPTRPLAVLNPDEMATRSMYLLAKAIEYISADQKQSQDLSKRIEEGEMHIQSLEDWYAALPVSYNPIPISAAKGSSIASSSAVENSSTIFKPIWIHPPRYSASVQFYCFAKIIILVNMPSTGGMDDFHTRQTLLEEAVSRICGLAQAPDDAEPARAFISVQCLFVAGQCTRDRERQEALLKIMENCMCKCKWLRRGLIEDLKATWNTP